MKVETRSEALAEKSTHYILGGVNSPIRTFQGVGCDPLIVASGKGSKIYDVEGREYTDYCMSWGAMILGHAHPQILSSVEKRIHLGTSFGITSEEEIAIAEKIVTDVPSIERVRFVSSGTEATMTAVRIARGFTGREYLVKFNGNYHGHADLFLVKAGSGATSFDDDSFSAGVPRAVVEKTISIPYNDIKAVSEIFAEYSGKIAAVIVEPIAGNMGLVPATQRFLETLRDVTQKDGSLLIFDEVISGFRVGMTGAQGHYGIEPDLTTFGKIIAGGFPAAMVGGKEEIMNVLAPIGTVYQAGTLSGNPVAMAAGFAAIQTLENEKVHAHLEELGRYLEEKIVKVLTSGIFRRIGSMFTIFFMDEPPMNQEDVARADISRFNAYFSHMLSRGIYVPQSQFECGFLSVAHTVEDIDAFVDAVSSFEEM